VTASVLPAVIGYLIFALFAGFLALKIGAVPLTIIVGAVLLMCLYDFVQSIRDE
jgi:hypothetical protein